MHTDWATLFNSALCPECVDEFMSLIKQHLFDSMNNTDFICVDSVKTGQSCRGFGSAKQAEKHGLYMIQTAGVFGFAVIAEDKDGWVIDPTHSILPPNVSVTQDLQMVSM